MDFSDKSDLFLDLASCMAPRQTSHVEVQKTIDAIDAEIENRISARNAVIQAQKSGELAMLLSDDMDFLREQDYGMMP